VYCSSSANQRTHQSYFIRLAKVPNVDTGYQKATSHLDGILEDQHITTAHVVFKHPRRTIRSRSVQKFLRLPISESPRPDEQTVTDLVEC